MLRSSNPKKQQRFTFIGVLLGFKKRHSRNNGYSLCTNCVCSGDGINIKAKSNQQTFKKLKMIDTIKIKRNRFIPFGRYKAINLFGVLYVKDEVNDLLDNTPKDDTEDANSGDL